MNINILDCTLRDGGYINQWKFGKKCITNTLKRLSTAGIEIIEAGFLDDTLDNYSGNNTVFSDIESAEKLIDADKNNYVLMIMHGKYDAEKLSQYSDGKIKGIRYCFKKEATDEALKKCRIILNKGFDVYLQPASLTDYSDKEIISLVEKANLLKIKVFYMVDTYGLMRRDEVIRYFYIIDNNLKDGVPIGFHSHNNLQLSFSNSQALIEINKKRDIYIDSSVFGMGRGAGNLCTELLTQYINENVEDKYDLIPILEIMDEHIMPIYTQHPWGYSAPYCLAAINNCHPNYATFLMDKQTLCIRDINSIIKSIPAEKKHLYDSDLINELYIEYQQRNINDSEVVAKISALCANRTVLILAPGKSLLTMRNAIQSYIDENDPVIFAINHIPDQYKYDKVFTSNLKRFKSIDDAAKKIKDKLIFASNITDDSTYDIVNYSDYLVNDEAISDNSGLMLINVLRKAGVNSFALAGYDGFKYDENTNYFDNKMINNVQYEKQQVINKAIIGYFTKLRKSAEVKFITPTIYDGGADYE